MIQLLLLYQEVHSLNRMPLKYVKARIDSIFELIDKGIMDAFIASKGIQCAFLHI